MNGLISPFPKTVVTKQFTHHMVFVLSNPEEKDSATEAMNNALSEGVRENIKPFLEGLNDPDAEPG